MTGEQVPEYVDITVAVPITLRIRRETVGFWLGPDYLWRAKFTGAFDAADQTGRTPEEAAWRMAERLKGMFS